jgi:hypothetical protein
MRTTIDVRRELLEDCVTNTKAAYDYKVIGLYSGFGAVLVPNYNYIEHYDTAFRSSQMCTCVHWTCVKLRSVYEMMLQDAQQTRGDVLAK